ncbi:hypothetical protein, partial [Phascolarctobacterium sp.]
YPCADIVPTPALLLRLALACVPAAHCVHIITQISCGEKQRQLLLNGRRQQCYNEKRNFLDEGF